MLYRRRLSAARLRALRKLCCKAFAKGHDVELRTFWVVDAAQQKHERPSAKPDDVAGAGDVAEEVAGRSGRQSRWPRAGGEGSKSLRRASRM